MFHQYRYLYRYQLPIPEENIGIGMIEILISAGRYFFLGFLWTMVDSVRFPVRLHDIRPILPLKNVKFRLNGRYFWIIELKFYCTRSIHQAVWWFSLYSLRFPVTLRISYGQSLWVRGENTSLAARLVFEFCIHRWSIFFLFFSYQ